MPQTTIFLTLDEAIDALCIDFRQYDAQYMLFAEIAPLISDRRIHIKREPDKSGAWITRPNKTAMQWCNDGELVEFMCRLVKEAHWTIDRLCAVCSRTFQTRAFPACWIDTKATGICIDAGMDGFVCRQCGNCCQRLDYHDQVDQADMDHWERLGRHDIQQWVKIVHHPDGRPTYRIWVNPDSGGIAHSCPFLKRDAQSGRIRCTIHDAKPAICRQYPASRKHAMMTGCRGFEKKS